MPFLCNKHISDVFLDEVFGAEDREGKDEFSVRVLFVGEKPETCDRCPEHAIWLVRPYPEKEGDFTIIGPECFTDKDAYVISYKGQNYYQTK